MTTPTVIEARIVTGEGGGPDKTILNTPRFMKERGYPTVCVYLRPPGDPGFRAIEERARRWDAPLIAVDDSGPFDFSILKKLRRICETQRPAIWHGHDYKTNLLGLLLARKHPMTLVTTLHGWVKRTWKTPLYYALDRCCIRRYDAAVAVSKDLFEAGLACGVPADRCHLVPNAIDTEEFKRTLATEVAKAKRGVAATRFLIGAVGRLSAEKGFDLLIGAVADFCDEGLDLECHIAGEGNDRQRLERLIEERRVQDRIKLLGFQSDLGDFYQSLDVFVLSSIREGLPNVILEAMAYEAPVLATRIAGVPEVVDHERTGLLAEPGSKEAIAVGLRRMIEDGALRRGIATNGRALIEKSYSFAMRMDRMKEIYDETLKRGGRR